MFDDEDEVNKKEALLDAFEGIGSDWRSEAEAMSVNPNPYEGEKD